MLGWNKWIIEEEDPDGEDPDGEDPDGEDPDGEDPDGEDPDGEDPEGEGGDGEAAAEDGEEKEIKEEWYESKTIQVAVGVALSASTIALLLFIF